MVEYSYVAIIGDKRIPCSAAVVETYRRIYKDVPVHFQLIANDDIEADQGAAWHLK